MRLLRDIRMVATCYGGANWAEAMEQAEQLGIRLLWFNGRLWVVNQERKRTPLTVNGDAGDEEAW